jgi:hypothetical protein
MATLPDKGQHALPLEPPAASEPVRQLVNADLTSRTSRTRGERLRAIVRDMFTTRLDKSTSRLGLVALAFVGMYGVIGGKLMYLGLRPGAQVAAPADLYREVLPW